MTGLRGAAVAKQTPIKKPIASLGLGGFFLGACFLGRLLFGAVRPVARPWRQGKGRAVFGGNHARIRKSGPPGVGPIFEVHHALLPRAFPPKARSPCLITMACVCLHIAARLMTVHCIKIERRSVTKIQLKENLHYVSKQ